ncbi:MAG TPA: elongation factor G [Calditrichia bacterium]|nr:elongation factor G [Calditrichia bacterium]
MKVYSSDRIRNIGIGGHSGSGKTSLAEAVLFAMGRINRIGTVENGNTVSDFNQDEIERQISLSASLLHGDWHGTKVNLIDTPGFSDFLGEVSSGMRAADIMMIVVDGANGVEVGTERVRQLADEYKLPRFYVINKLEKENVSYMDIYKDLRDRFGKALTIVDIPLKSGPGFSTVVDVLHRKVYRYETDGSGKGVEEPLEGEIAEKVEKIRSDLVEAVAESDDALLEKYFEEGTLSDEEIMAGFKKAVIKRQVVPVLCASAVSNIGSSSLLDFIVDYLPAPSALPPFGLKDGGEVAISENEKLVAQVFKTSAEAHVGELSYVKVFSGVLKTGDEVFNSTHNRSERIGQMFLLNGKDKEGVEEVHAGDVVALVKLKSTHTGDTLTVKGNSVEVKPIAFPEPLINIAVEPVTQGEEDKVGTGLHTLHLEDPTLLARFDGELKQTIVSGQGELHLSIALKRLKERFNVEVKELEPKIPYRETIRATAEAQGKFKKQSGGRGQYGDAHLRIEPLPRGTGFEFVDAIVGGAIPGKFIPAVEKGCAETIEKGVISGCKVVDVKVTVFDGTYHNVDSSENAFKVAASMGFKKAFLDAKPMLLEPIYKLEVKVPEAYMGDVMGDISSRRGKIAGMDTDGRFQVINATVPLSELYKYTTTLRSITHGQGIFHREFSHYEEVPGDVAQKIVDAYKSGDDEE